MIMLCYDKLNIVCICFSFIFRLFVIESRNDRSKIDEIIIELRNVSKIIFMF